METFTLKQTEEYIELKNLIKLLGWVDTGGEAKVRIDNLDQGEWCTRNSKKKKSKKWRCCCVWWPPGSGKIKKFRIEHQRITASPLYEMLENKYIVIARMRHAFRMT